jgi:hypothetical protein
MDIKPPHCCCCCQAISTAADLAKIHNSKVTVLVVDQPGAEGDPTVKLQVINKVRAHACIGPTCNHS